MAWPDLVQATAPSEALAWVGGPGAAKGSWVACPMVAQTPYGPVLRMSWRAHAPSSAHHVLFCSVLRFQPVPQLQLGFCLDEAA